MPKIDTVKFPSRIKKFKLNKKNIINLWMVIFIILVAITGVFTYASFFNLGNLDKDVSKEFSLILIPITAGGIVTKFTTDSWQITKEKLEDAAITQNKLLSSTRLYFGNEELEKLIIQLGDELNNKLDVLRRLMFSDNPTELEKYYKLFTEKTKEVKNKVKEVEEKMIKLKFREINL